MAQPLPYQVDVQRSQPGRQIQRQNLNAIWIARLNSTYILGNMHLMSAKIMLQKCFSTRQGAIWVLLHLPDWGALGLVLDWKTVLHHNIKNVSEVLDCSKQLSPHFAWGRGWDNIILLKPLWKCVPEPYVLQISMDITRNLKAVICTQQMHETN